jgi:WD40 repeat protein
MTRLKWNLVNPNFILTVIVDKNEIYILDQRKLSAPYGILKVHTNVVNNAIWAPQSNSNLISVSDDKSALLWDIYCDSKKPEEFIMKYEAEYEIENVAWGDVTQNWIGIIDGNQAEILRIQ